MKIKSILIALTTLINGCSILGPKYVQPQIETMVSWPNMQETNNKTAVFANTAWWQKFKDNNLNKLVIEALENNNDIQMALGNIISAEGKLQKVKMDWVPNISLGLNAGFGKSFNNNVNFPNNPNFGQYSPGASDIRFYSGTIIPSYSLNILQQFKKQDAAKNQLSLNIQNKNAIKLAVISQVINSYFTLLALYEQKSIYKNIIANLTTLTKLTQLQYDNGLISSNYVDESNIKLSQAKMQLPSIEASIVATENALKVITNKNPDRIINKNTFSNIKLDNNVPISLPSEVLKNRPDIIQAEEQLKLSNANIGVATSAFFPSISLTSPIGTSSLQLDNLFKSTGDFWLAQISATMPILNLGIGGLIKQAKGQYYVAYYNYIKTVRNSFMEVDNSLNSFFKLQQVIREANNSYKHAKADYRNNLLSYKQGNISYLQVLPSKITMYNMTLALNQTKLQQLQNLIRLHQALAVGYKYNNDDKIKQFGDDHDL